MRFSTVLDDLIHRVVDPLDHAGEHEPRLHHVLIGIDADHEMRGAAVPRPFLDGIERAEPGVAGGREDDVRALGDLRERSSLPCPGLFHAASVTPT